MTKAIMRKVKDVIRRRCNVHGAQVVAIAMLNGFPVCIRTNVRGGGQVSKWSHHAEERAIQYLTKHPAYRYGKPASLLIIRYRKNGTIGNAKPCDGCKELMKKYIDQRFPVEVCWSNDDGSFTPSVYFHHC